MAAPRLNSGFGVAEAALLRLNEDCKGSFEVVVCEGCGEGEEAWGLRCGETQREFGRRNRSWVRWLAEEKGWVTEDVSGAGGAGNNGVGRRVGKVGGLGVAFSSPLCSNSS